MAAILSQPQCVNTKMAELVKILPHERQGPVYPTLLI